MKFAFAFEKLLEIRARIEDVARGEFANADEALRVAKTQLEELFSAIDTARMRASSLEREGGCHSTALAQIGDFIKGQAVRIEQQRDRIRQAMAVAERAQAALVEAAKDRKTLEKLRERRLNESKAAAKKLELRQADELTTTRHKREAV